MERKQWHAEQEEAVLQHFSVDRSQGLDGEDVTRNLETHGKNVLPKPEKVPEWRKFLGHFNDVLIYVLLAAAVVTAVLGHFIDTAVILAVAIINAMIGYVQENRAEKALEGIQNMLSSDATVVREGRRLEIPADEVVPGDIVLFKAGDRLPADVRLIEANNLKVEESALTGESLAVQKQTAAIDADAVLGDQVNMAFSGTSISSGSGRGIVVATGEQTELGKINTSMVETEQLQTPLLRQTAQFGKTISFIILLIAGVSFIYGYVFHDYPTTELLLAVISLAVAAIPEGLPAILSIILALGVQTMAGNNAIVKNLPSVETLGAVSVICSDKTGTLTRNEMTVTSIDLKDAEYSVTGTGYAPHGEIVAGKGTDDPSTLKEFLTCIKTVNETSLGKNVETGQWEISGEPTEGCLLTVAEKAGSDIPALPPIDKIPFDSEYKYMAYLVETEGTKRLYVKGAPDRLLDMAYPDTEDEDRLEWEKKLVRIAGEGKRMLGAAYKDMPPETSEITHEDLTRGMNLLGFAGIIDPPREEAILAVEESKRAGINVKMITGDHKDTAIAIGRQLGIGDGRQAIEGRELDGMTEDELARAAMEYDIFARTSPQNKLQLVTALQEQKQITSMTGDGVNDAPALKRADIGVAMGIKGTEVSKEAARMILVDDNFETIVKAVREGRRVYDNLKKTILFILPTNGAEAFLILAALMFGLAMPLTPVQILWVNMVVSVTVSLALAFEKLEPSSMKRPPRPPETRLLSGYYIFRIALVSLLVGGGILLVNLELHDMGYPADVINTVTLQSIVFAQLFHLYNCRSEVNFALNRNFFTNRIAFMVSGLLVLLQIGVTYLPFMNTILGTVPIALEYWLIPIAIGISVFILIEVEKWITRSIIKRKSLPADKV